MSQPKLELRGYQKEAVEALRASYRAKKRAPLLQLPTGAGKTIIFAHVVKGAMQRRNSVLVLVHKRELVAQTSAKLDWAEVPHGIIAAGYPAAPDMPVQVASIQTLVRRPIGQYRFVVIDEAHHAVADTWRTVLNTQLDAKLLGTTATPLRLDGTGLGVKAGGFFDDLICGASIRRLIDEGWLSKVRYFIPEHQADLSGAQASGENNDFVLAQIAALVNRPHITGDAVQKYAELAPGLPAIAFCSIIEHAEDVAAQFREAGFRSACVHGNLPKTTRDALIAGLGNGEVQVLTSCDLISEGLDVPALGAVILLRPTASLVMHLQQIGRGLRPAPGKPPLVVLDHVGNLNRHGLPEAERVWTLDGVEEGEPAEEGDGKICPRCGYVNEQAAKFCGECNLAFEGSGYGESGRSIPPQVAGDLAELTDKRKHEVEYMRYWNARTSLSEAELRHYAAHRGYKRGWVEAVLRERTT